MTYFLSQGLERSPSPIAQLSEMTIRLDLPRIVPVRIGLSLAFNRRQDHEPRRTSVQISAPNVDAHVSNTR